MADEDLILERDARADERVAGNLAAPADARAALDFDEGADARLVADLAAIKVDEGEDFPVVELAEGDVSTEDAEEAIYKAISDKKKLSRPGRQASR